MSWTTFGTFSFWPTRSTSPAAASRWLAPTTRLTYDGPLQGRPRRGTRSSASPKVTTAWWRWWLIAWRQAAEPSSIPSTAPGAAASTRVASTFGA